MRGKPERNTPKAKKIHRTASRLAASSPGDAFVFDLGSASSSAAVVGTSWASHRASNVPAACLVPACFPKERRDARAHSFA